jgi:hypothetical protein
LTPDKKAAYHKPPFLGSCAERYLPLGTILSLFSGQMKLNHYALEYHPYLRNSGSFGNRMKQGNTVVVPQAPRLLHAETILFWSP